MMTTASSAQTGLEVGKIALCPNRPYALCANAQCRVLNGVAYCQCPQMKGTSVSSAYEYETNGKKEDVCSIMKDGEKNNYLVSTYSTPEGINTPSGNTAVYDCPGGKDADPGAFAQCDGGVCFKGTEGTTFLFDLPVPKGTIICSCPIVSGRDTKHGYQIDGPYNKDPKHPCDQSWFQYCHNSVANTNTGSTVYVGYTVGLAQAFAEKLLGKPNVHYNECKQTQ